MGGKTCSMSKQKENATKAKNAKQKLGYINTVCSAEKSFSQQLNYSETRGTVQGVTSADSSTQDDDIVEFLIAV